MRQKPVHHVWCGLNLSKCLSRFLGAVCVLGASSGEFGMAQQRDFATWPEFRAEAVALGIRPQTLDAALTGLRRCCASSNSTASSPRTR